MPHSLSHIKRNFDEISANCPIESTIESCLAPKSNKEKPLPRRVPIPNASTSEALEIRQEFFRGQGFEINALTGKTAPVVPEEIVGNIESQLGYISLPVGVLGPLRINGTYANGDFYVPLATTEGALLASYSRGAHVISASGGVSTACVADSVVRAPVFIFEKLSEAVKFVEWVIAENEKFYDLVADTTRHGKLIDIKTTMNNSHVYLTFEYSTGDAAGQNMVTIATDHICRYIIEKTPHKPQKWYLDGNLSGDKKATMLSFLGNRGKKVIAEVVIPRRTVERFLHTTPEEMLEFGQMTIQGAAQSGGIGIQGHYANALAAIYMACGQDVACVSESAVGISTMKITENGDLYCSVSLPNLIVGTVGGGTHLPTSSECLKMLGCKGPGTARKFAEICAATVLSGEISIVAAFAAGHFARAHATHRHKA